MKPMEYQEMENVEFERIKKSEKTGAGLVSKNKKKYKMVKYLRALQRRSKENFR